MKNTDITDVKHIFLKNEEETRLLGLKIANAAEPGDIIALTGGPGAGKTTLTKYIAEGLGVREIISSPTFTIVKEYKSGRLPLYHFDAYRLSGGDEFLDTGAGEYLGGDGVCVIEWADIVADILPGDCFALRLDTGGGENERTAEIL